MSSKKTISFVCSHLDFYGHQKYVYDFENIQAKTKAGITSFFKNNQILEETLDEHIYWRPKAIARANCYDPISKSFNREEIESRRALIHDNFTDFSSAKESFEKTVIDITHSFGHYVFGHLFDSLQRLFHLKKIIEDTDVKFLVSRFDQIIDFKQHLSILCRKDIGQQLILAQENEIINIEKLYFSLTPTAPTEIDEEAYHWIVEQYYRFYNIKETKPIYNLYLSRNHIKNNFRGVINNDEVIDRLLSQNYIILYGNEPLKEIIHYFANAKTIIGCHGSLFANCMFCNSKTEIIEYCPQNRKDSSFKNKFKMAQNYTQYLVEADNLYNITIPIHNV